MYLQVQYEGLQTAYMEDAATNTLIKKFLALPMLPGCSQIALTLWSDRAGVRSGVWAT